VTLYDLATSLTEDLEVDEGWVEHAYQDHLGYWTIGYGFLIDDRKGGRLPREVGDFWLKLEIDQRYAKLRKALPWLLAQPEPVQRALVNMAYQMGVSGVLKFKTTLSLIQQGKYEEAADNALKSKWSRQTPERAKRVTDLIRNVPNVGT